MDVRIVEIEADHAVHVEERQRVLASVPREAATQLNAFVCPCGAGGTMENCASMVSDLGYAISSSEEAADSLSKNLFNLTSTLAAALRYEVALSRLGTP